MARGARGARRQADHYTRAAQAQGFPARSVFKLQELDQRHRLLRGGLRVLDLGAAPGSWTRYALQRIGPGGSVTAVDLSPRPSALAAADSRLRYLQADLTGAELRAQLRGERFDLILSDAAPATSGHHGVDAACSAELVAAAIGLACEVLDEGCTLVAKLLQGEELPALIELARESFARVRTAKPRASRSVSSETFLLAFGYRAQVQVQVQANGDP